MCGKSGGNILNTSPQPKAKTKNSRAAKAPPFLGDYIDDKGEMYVLIYTAIISLYKRLVNCFKQSVADKSVADKIKSVALNLLHFFKTVASKLFQVISNLFQ